MAQNCVRMALAKICLQWTFGAVSWNWWEEGKFCKVLREAYAYFADFPGRSAHFRRFRSFRVVRYFSRYSQICMLWPQNFDREIRFHDGAMRRDRDSERREVMKKFTFKGVLDNFRTSVAQQSKPDQEIQETLRPEHFQVKRVSFNSRCFTLYDFSISGCHLRVFWF